jgi:hypothetical protein
MVFLSKNTGRFVQSSIGILFGKRRSKRSGENIMIGFSIIDRRPIIGL